jgi:16S rRNA (cytidine1402-2'-O)-methyltransferase
VKGTLFIVATPIGNLEDITLRAIRVLREAGLVAAEDTRRTGKLFQAHGIRTPLTSLHDWNERGKSAAIMEKLLAGTNVACVSDAGTPGISDPGYVLVKTALERGIPVVPVPGPSAIITAVSVSGLPMDRFVFFGFLPSRGSQRRKFLASLADEEKTMIFHESPRRLLEALEDLGELLGDREIVVARELTKLHEEILRGTVSAVRDLLKDNPPRGEITLLVSGRAKKSAPPEPGDALRDRILELAGEGGASVRDLVSRLTEETGLPRSMVYREVLQVLKKK